MSATIGILIDVSGSMAESIKVPGNYHQTSTESWVRSTFKVVDNLIKYDVGSKADVFAICYGAGSKPELFDLLNTLKANCPANRYWNSWNKDRILCEILDILKRYGAPRVGYWANMEVLRREVSYDESKFILKMLVDSPRFRSEVVYRILPNACRSEPASYVSWGFQLVAKHVFPGATENEMRNCIQNVLYLLKNNASLWGVVAVRVSPSARISVSVAHEILHGRLDEQNLTDAKISEHMKTIEPYIYGGTPMIEALQAADSLFKRSTSSNKLLFVLSDGIPSDSGMIPNFDESGVKVVCCFITENPETDPKRMYCIMNDRSRDETKLMFDLSSSVPTQSLPRTIFIKRDWKIVIENNETKLFFPVNHPDLIHEVCNFAKDLVSSKDALCDVLSSVSLDLYINITNEGLEAKTQKYHTCYANAAATVVHLAMKRIIGRDGGCPDFVNLRKEIIAKFGEEGANTLIVLNDICPQYRLQCQKTDIKGACMAVAAKRPVVARFSLTKLEWDAFKQFYRKNPKGILTKSHLGRRGQESTGHAVVLVSYNSESLRFMNSWGTDFADNGFFRVCSSVLDLEFIDVFWKLQDLQLCEITAYRTEGPKIAKKLLSDLTGLIDSAYECPLCERESPVIEFKGKLVQATCPKCGEAFDVNEREAYDLVLYMYLTSLCDYATDIKDSYCFTPEDLSSSESQIRLNELQGKPNEEHSPDLSCTSRKHLATEQPVQHEIEGVTQNFSDWQKNQTVTAGDFFMKILSSTKGRVPPCVQTCYLDNGKICVGTTLKSSPDLQAFLELIEYETNKSIIEIKVVSAIKLFSDMTKEQIHEIANRMKQIKVTEKISSGSALFPVHVSLWEAGTLTKNLDEFIDPNYLWQLHRRNDYVPNFMTIGLTVEDKGTQESYLATCFHSFENTTRSEMTTLSAHTEDENNATKLLRNISSSEPIGDFVGWKSNVDGTPDTLIDIALLKIEETLLTATYMDLKFKDETGRTNEMKPLEIFDGEIAELEDLDVFIKGCISGTQEGKIVKRIDSIQMFGSLCTGVFVVRSHDTDPEKRKQIAEKGDSGALVYGYHTEQDGSRTPIALGLVLGGGSDTENDQSYPVVYCTILAKAKSYLKKIYSKDIKCCIAAENQRLMNTTQVANSEQESELLKSGACSAIVEDSPKSLNEHVFPQEYEPGACGSSLSNYSIDNNSAPAEVAANNTIGHILSDSKKAFGPISLGRSKFL